MSATSEFYLARANDCARDAEGASLDNVRDRFLRAEHAWRAMADQITRSEDARRAREG
ncbi:hypothetical protein [Sphingomonas sp. ID0503]|uniref:hypothetical protein n=1 Tax=Sphingomonas sp. ID0503 TaxID=3399691 RepID=UPI003AFAB522